MGCWSREAGGGAGSASGGRSHRWVGRQAAAPSPLPRGGGRAGTETSGTTAPAAGPQQGERAAVSRRRPAGPGHSGSGCSGRSGQGRAGSRQQIRDPAPEPERGLRGRGPASSPPRARR